MQKLRATRTQNTLAINYPASQQQLHKVISYSNYILDLQLGITAYVRSTWDAKEQSKIILLNLTVDRVQNCKDTMLVYYS